MNRRLLLGTAAATASLAAPALAQSQPEVRWRLASSFPRSLDVLYGTAERICARVAALTENRFRIQPHPAGEIVPPLQVLDAVQNGTIECGHTAPYYYIGKDPTFAFFTAVPFGLNARMNTAWMTQGEGRGLLEEFMRGYSVKSLPAGDTGAQMGGWFRTEVKSLDELKGLKFRIAGLAGQLFARLGAVPTQIAAGDIYSALERGTLDAVEFVGPHDDEKLGFVRVARFYYAPGFWEAGARLHFMSNQRAWDALPAPYREAIETACGEANAEMLARYDMLNPPALRRLIAAGAQLRFWPREVLQAAWRESHALYDDLSGRNEMFRKVWTSYRAFRDEDYQWFRVSENSFDNFAFVAAGQQRGN
jgi:TRAP-type mannitol/chloroaromatic compound transport system substrate-binding protein